VSAPAALDDDIRLAHLAELAGAPDGLDTLDGFSAAAAAFADVGAVGPHTADIVGRLVGVVVAAILRECFRSGGRLPPELGELVGQLDTTVIRAWRDLADGGRPQPAAGAGGGRVASLRELPARSVLAEAQLCTLFAVDIAGFTRPDRDDDIRRYLHEHLYGMLQKAFDGSGIPWAACWHEDRGDGALVVVPPGVSGLGLVGPLPERLRGLVRRHNHVARDAARIQLRAAAHFGMVEYDGHGYVGSDVNLLFRLLDAPPLKRVLAASGADLAMIVSDHVYRSFVCQHPSLISPDTFEAVRFRVKQARFQGWTHLPGADAVRP
jgi:hypothetical protein